jgi:hypothetical protein
MPLVEVKNYPQPVIDGLKAALARNDDWTAVAAKAAKDALVEHLIKIPGQIGYSRGKQCEGRSSRHNGLPCFQV